MRRVISHPPTRSATSAHHCHPSLAAPPRPARHRRTAADRVSRNCHLSSRRFTVPFTRSADTRASPSFQRFISARSLVYPRLRQRTTPQLLLSSRVSPSRCTHRPKHPPSPFFSSTSLADAISNPGRRGRILTAEDESRSKGRNFKRQSKFSSRIDRVDRARIRKEYVVSE